MTEINENQMGSEKENPIENNRVVENQQMKEISQPIHPSGYDIETIERFEFKHAGFWTRFWAYLIDMVVIFSISRLIVYPVFRMAGWDLTRNEWYAPIVIISAVIFYAYFVLMTKFFQQTIGKMVLGIKVISLKNEKLTWSDILFREWIGRFISTTILILYAVIAFTKKKQGIHDLFADTTVIHEGIYEKNVQRVYMKRESVEQLQEPNAF